MKHLINYTTYNESQDPYNELVIIESIGLLLNPENEILGYPEGIKPNSGQSRELVTLLKDFLKGRELDETQKAKIMPVLLFVEDLHDRSKKDDSVSRFLEKYKKDGQKESGVLSKVKELYPKMKREKNPLFGE
jgi:hypothetical protein